MKKKQINYDSVNHKDVELDLISINYKDVQIHLMMIFSISANNGKKSRSSS